MNSGAAVTIMALFVALAVTPVQICRLTSFPTGIQSHGRDDENAACGDDRGAAERDRCTRFGCETRWHIQYFHAASSRSHRTIRD